MIVIFCHLHCDEWWVAGGLVSMQYVSSSSRKSCSWMSFLPQWPNIWQMTLQEHDVCQHCFMKEVKNWNALVFRPCLSHSDRNLLWTDVVYEGSLCLIGLLDEWEGFILWALPYVVVSMYSIECLLNSTAVINGSKQVGTLRICRIL